MGAGRPTTEVEALARELCASEGWDPDDRIDCDPAEAPFARLCPTTGQWICARWEVYAPAAERLAQARLDTWETF
jgi:hypothetical protein